MPALRDRKTVCGVSHAAAGLREVRARLCLHRFRRRPCGIHHHCARGHRRRMPAERRDKMPAAVLAACRIVAAADSGDHAVAAALDEGAADRAAISPQGRGRPADRSRAAMTVVSATPRSVAGLGIFTAMTLALLIGLGVWQLQRRVEKHALIAQLTERLAAAPAALPPLAQWSALTQAADDFRRVRFSATYEQRPDAMVYSAGSAIREDISGPGTWAFLPARLPTGETIVVNTGFVQNTMQNRVQQDRAVTRLVPGAPVTLTGYIRFPESPGALTPSENLDKRLWFTRDHLAIARSLGWGQVAPLYIDLESPAPESGIPKPGPLEVHLKDDHLQYAITWFGLAGAVVIAFGVWLRGQRS